MPQSDSAPEPHAGYAGPIVAVACALAVTSTAIALLVLPFGHSLAGTRDFAIFWATGRQLVHHGNPWSASVMEQIERSAGFTSRVSFMRNPPWALPLTLPLGFFSARAAALPWSLFFLAVLVLSLASLWKTFPRPASPIDWIGYCFPPALVCIAMGQTSLLMLLGLVLFLRFHASRPFLAGAGLWFCTLKPHLFLPFGVALFLWILLNRAWKIVLGTLAALAASVAVTSLLDPHAWSQYLAWTRHSGISREFIPCLAVEFRILADPRAAWLAFLPAILACAWAAAWFWRRRHRWSWLDQGALLMLVSLLVAPYCWINDQCLAIPALLFAASRTRSRPLIAALGVLCLILELQIFLSSQFDSLGYLWPAPAWLLWFLLARRSAAASATDVADAPLHSRA